MILIREHETDRGHDLLDSSTSLMIRSIVFSLRSKTQLHSSMTNVLLRSRLQPSFGALLELSSRDIAKLSIEGYRRRIVRAELQRTLEGVARLLIGSMGVLELGLRRPQVGVARVQP